MMSLPRSMLGFFHKVKKIISAKVISCQVQTCTAGNHRVVTWFLNFNVKMNRNIVPLIADGSKLSVKSNSIFLLEVFINLHMQIPNNILLKGICFRKIE